MKHAVILIAAYLTLIATPSIVLAQSSGSSQAGPVDDTVAIYKEAGINAEQESSIRKLGQEYDQETAIRFKTLNGLLQELRTLAYQPILDGDALLAKQEQINKLQSEMAMQRIHMIIKIRGILTASQNQKLANLLQARMHDEEQAPQLK